jgi:catechol 2,3-dioxygenase-like lactoylglutathione lyase family enzyme
MFIERVTLTVSDVELASDFFDRVLQLPVTRYGQESEVRVGASTLRLQPGPGGAGVHHLAFEIPVDTFPEHRRWLESRVRLLRHADGRTEFEGPPHWGSRSLYFPGPDEMVLELICRRPRPQPERSPVPSLLSVSEVGVAVPDVPAAVRRLGEVGLPAYGTPGESFAPVGDEWGLLILVSPGRPWLPVFDVTAEPRPLTVAVTPGSGPGVPGLRPSAATAPVRIALNERAGVEITGWEG